MRECEGAWPTNKISHLGRRQRRPVRSLGLLVLLPALLLVSASLSAAEPPVIPVGADAYGMWDHWAYQRIGERAYMRQ
jgi:hypothetical protein